MQKCKKHEICNLDALPGTDEKLCILHSQDPNKDKDAFNEALKAHKKGLGWDFRLFYFPVKANFRNVRFPEGADFFGATFGDGATFDGSTLGDKASFWAATFGDEAMFGGSTFGNHAAFSGSTFGDKATFSGSTFGDKATFNKATFGDGATFDGSTFGNGANFFGATFREKAYFRETKFLGRAIFVGKEENEKTVQIFSGVQMDFRKTISEQPGALAFRDADLRMCRFLGMDLRHIEFAAVKWPDIPVGFFIIKKVRTAVYDEVLLREGETTSRSHIEKLYRELKQNYEDRRDYELAGDFHYGEKEMRRKNPDTPLGRKFLLWFYWLMSGYGERCVRPMLWAALVLILSTFGYLYWGMEPKVSNSGMVMTNGCGFLEALHYSLRVMLFLKPDDWVPVGFGKFINTVQGVLGPVLIGLFALALRQRLKR